jgi:hypothetical protein
MPVTRIVFQTTTTTELKFQEADVTYDGGMVTVWQGNEKRFAVPIANLVAIERLPEMPAPEPPTQSES